MSFARLALKGMPQHDRLSLAFTKMARNPLVMSSDEALVVVAREHTLGELRF